MLEASPYYYYASLVIAIVCGAIFGVGFPAVYRSLVGAPQSIAEHSDEKKQHNSNGQKRGASHTTTQLKGGESELPSVSTTIRKSERLPSVQSHLAAAPPPNFEGSSVMLRCSQGGASSYPISSNSPAATMGLSTTCRLVVVVGPPFTSTSTANKEVGSGLGNDHQREGGVKGESLPSVVDEGAFIRLVLVSRTLTLYAVQEKDEYVRRSTLAAEDALKIGSVDRVAKTPTHHSIKTGSHDILDEAKSDKLKNNIEKERDEEDRSRRPAGRHLLPSDTFIGRITLSSTRVSSITLVMPREVSSTDTDAANSSGYGVVLKVREEGGREEGRGLLDTLSALRRGEATGSPLQQASSVAWRECRFSFETYREACRWYNALHDTLMNSSKGARAAKKDGGERSTGVEKEEEKEEEDRLAMWGEALNRFINASGAVPLGEHSSDLTSNSPFSRSVASSVAAALATRIVFGTNGWDSCRGDYSQPIETAFTKSFSRYARESLVSKQRIFDSHSQKSDGTVTKKDMATPSTFLVDESVTDDPLLVVLPKHIQKRKRLHNGIKKLAGASQSSEAEESDTNEEGNVIAAMRLVKMRACGRGSQSLARQYGLTQVAADVQRSHACVPSARFYELQRQNNKKDDISCPTTNTTELSNAKYRHCRGDDEQDGEKFFAVAPSVREVNFDLGIASVASHPFIELIVKVFLYNSSLSNSNTARPCDGENKEEEPLFSEPLYAYVKLEDLDGIVRTNISSPTVPDGDAYTDVKRVSTPELWFGFCGRPAASVTCELISPATHSLVYRDVGSLDDEGIGRALSAYEQAVTLLAAAKEAPLSSLESRIADEVFEALFAEVTLPHYGSLPMPTLVSAQQMDTLDTASTTSIATKSQRQTQELIEMWTKESLQLMSAFTEAQSCLHYARCEALYAEATQRSAPQKGGFAVTLSEEHPPSSICAAQTISSTPPPHQTLGIHASLSTIELNIKAPLSSSASDLVQNLRRREESLRLALAEAKAAGAREHARRLEEAAKNDERRKAETHKNQERMAELEKRLQQEREKESARKHQQHFQSQQEQCAQARESSVDSSSGVVARKLLLTSQQRATDGEEVSSAVKPTTAPPPAALTNASLIDEVTATRIQNTERAITLLSETLQKLADRPPPLPAAVPIVTYSPALTPRYRHKSKGSGRPQSRLRGRHRAASPSSRSSSFSSSSPSSSSFEEEDGGVKGTDDNYDRGDSDAAVDHFELSTPKSSHVRRPTKEERRQAEKDKRNKKEGRKEEQNAKNNTPPPSTHLAAKNSSRKSTSPSASSSRSKGKAKGKMANGKESEDDAEKISKQRPPPPPPTILLDEAAAKQLFLSLQQEQREKEEAGKALREKAEEEEERVTRVKRRQLEEEERREKELVLMRERERVREEEKERAQRAFASTIQQLEDRLGREIAASRRREEEEDARHRRREAELASQIKAMQEQQNELQKAIKSANALGDHVRDREHQLQQTEASLKALQANLQEERNAQSALTKQRLAEEEARRAREELLKKELELKAKADAERLELTRKELEELKERTIASQAMAEERRRAEEAEKAKSKESEQEAQARLKEAEDAIISLQAQIIRSQTPPSSVSVASFSMVPPSRYSHDMIQGMGNLTTPRRHSSRVRVPSVHNTDGGLGSGRNAVASSPYDRYSSPVLDASVDNHSDPDNIDFLNSEYYSRRESVYSSSVAFPRGHSKLSAFSGGGSSVPHQNQQQGQQGRAYGTPPLTPRTNRQPLVNTNRDNHAKISSANDRNEHKDSKSRPRSRSNTIDNESVVEGGEGVTNIHEETGKAAPPRRLRKSKLRTDEEGGNEVDGDEYGSTAGEGDQSDYEYQRHEYVGRDPSVPRTILVDGFTTTGTDGVKEESASPSFDFMMQSYLCKVLGGAIVSNRLDVEGITAVPTSSSSSSSEVEKESAIVKASSTTKACPLEVDDMLLSCNGAPLHTLSQLYEATIRLAGGGGGGSDDARVLVLSCFRGGDVVDVEIAVTSEIS